MRLRFPAAVSVLLIGSMLATACGDDSSSTTTDGTVDGGKKKKDASKGDDDDVTGDDDDDDDDTGKTGDPQAQCVKLCEAAADLKCPKDETGDCAGDCTTTLKQLPTACDSDYVALTECVLGGKLSCDETEGTAVTDADCTTEQDALSACVKKEGGGSSGDECETCQTTKCEAELTTCQKNADCVTVIQCVNKCKDQDCANKCLSDTPNGADDFESVYTCVSDNCATECGG